jgi:hypothetical protein
LSALRQQAGQHHLIGFQLQVAVVKKEAVVGVLAVKEVVVEVLVVKEVEVGVKEGLEHNLKF